MHLQLEGVRPCATAHCSPIANIFLAFPPQCCLTLSFCTFCRSPIESSVGFFGSILLVHGLWVTKTRQLLVCCYVLLLPVLVSLDLRIEYRSKSPSLYRCERDSECSGKQEFMKRLRRSTCPGLTLHRPRLGSSPMTTLSTRHVAKMLFSPDKLWLR